MRLNDKEYSKMIDEISRDVCPNARCLLKLLVTRLHPDPRLMLQLKCIDKLSSSKFISMDDIIAAWIDEGYAIAFDMAYREAEVRFLKSKIPPEFEAVYARLLELAVFPKKTDSRLDFKI